LIGSYVKYCNHSATKTYLQPTVKGRVPCFSMQVVMNKLMFSPNPVKTLAQILLVVFEKNAKNAHFNSEK